jgi:hypothetical protein
MDVPRKILEWQAGELAAELLPDVACEALAQGYDGPNLQMLAGLIGVWAPDRVWEVEPLAPRALDEMGISERTRDEAALQLGRALAAEVASGDCDPRSGAQKLYFLWLNHLEAEALYPLSAFGSLTDQWDDDEAARAEIETKIAEDAKAFAG